MKKAQMGNSVKSSVASFKRTIGDTSALKKKADSIGVSTNKVKDALKARMDAKKNSAMKKGGKISKNK
jgi:hypothetical protein